MISARPERRRGSNIHLGYREGTCVERKNDDCRVIRADISGFQSSGRYGVRPSKMEGFVAVAVHRHLGT
jgi:hypothetical protein